MQYMFLIYSAEGAGPKSGSAEFETMMKGYGAFTEEMRQAGIMKEGAPLQGVNAATTVRVWIHPIRRPSPSHVDSRNLKQWTSAEFSPIRATPMNAGPKRRYGPSLEASVK